MAPPPSDAAAVLNRLERARARIAVGLLVRTLGWCCTVAALAGAAGLLTGALPPSAVWMAAPAALVAATAAVAFRYPTRRTAAAMLDARLGLDDRAAAALSVLDAADPFSRLVVRDAAVRLSGVRLATAFPLHVDRPAACGAASMAMLAALALMVGDRIQSSGVSRDGGGEWRAVATPPAGATAAERSDTAPVRDASPGSVAAERAGSDSDPATTNEQFRAPAREREVMQAAQDRESSRADAQQGDGGGTANAATAVAPPAGRAAAPDAAERPSEPHAATGAEGGGVGSGAGVGAASASAMTDRRSGGVRAGEPGAGPASSDTAAAAAGAVAGARAARPPDARSLQDTVPPRLRRVVRGYFLGLAAADPE